MDTQKKFVLAALLIYTSLLPFILSQFRISVFTSLILVYGAPLLLIGFLLKGFGEKPLLYSLLVIPLMFVIDYIAHINGT